ncbi:hypothetical protein J3R82DRAFT_4155 [Butyriboletus roseoflavus]|nr:hypothetical protein J3R82DRAFT_4155 [Butyriboletus roseoflavus]
MPLVVPVLRFFLVFLNVYETFKTLKPPPPSARRGGKPSVRATAQRKRDLKGCLAVWVVWVMHNGRITEVEVSSDFCSVLMREIKSVFLLFLVLTRAKGAEPLFLHVLRPLVKPYAALVDPTLELSRDIGDFLFALLQVPLNYVLSSSWFPSWNAGESEEEPGESSSGARISSADSRNSTRTSSHSSIPILADHGGAVQTSRVQNQRHGSVRSVSDNQRLSGRPSANNLADHRAARGRHSRSASTTSLPAYSEHPSHDPPRYSRIPSRRNGHQIWYPPDSVQPISGQEMPVSTLDLPETAPEYHSPEWRTYPAFPSAYPPTPLPASASLPGSVTSRSGNDYRLVSESAYPPIPEDEQGFGEMLERQREGHPGSVHSSSNNNKIPPGVNSYQERSSATREPDEDTPLDDSMCSSEAGLSEDDFGTFLRTPDRSPATMPSNAYSSADSLASALTTTDKASSSRAKTSSDSSSSGSSSLAGRKRTHGAFQGKARSTFPTSHLRSATLRGRPTPPPILQDPLQSSTSGDEDEDEIDDDDGSTKTKRQRVLDPLKRRSTLRPAARRMGGDARKAPLPSRSVAARVRVVTTVSQATARTRTGSVATNNSTLKGRKPTFVSCQVIRGGSQGVVKSSSTSSSQSGTLKGRAY